MNINITKVSDAQPSADLIGFCKDYQWIDCWKAELPERSQLSSYDWAYMIFSGQSSPKAIIFLMSLRNRIMKPFKTDGVYEAEKIGTFPLLKKTDRETILGKTDRHLTFSVSIKLENENQRVSCTTIMKTHNALGKVYWLIVGKIHPLVIKISLRYAIARVNNI